MVVQHIKRFIIILLASILLFTITSCKGVYSKPVVFENDYYRYVIEQKKFFHGIYVIGFTELGLEQKELIFPYYIDDIPVVGVGYQYQIAFWTWDIINEFNSVKLEKLYYPLNMNDFSNCTISGYSNLPNCFILSKKLSWTSSFELKGGICSFFDYLSFSLDTNFSQDLIRKIANVEYLYNYDNAPSDNYYWIDSFNNSLISFIPPNPTRQDFVFIGWFKEPECLNEWDFNVDYTSDEILFNEINQYTAYNGISLYAKWI
jgi:hypothetical protein